MAGVIHALNVVAVRLMWMPLAVVLISAALLVYWATDDDPPVRYVGNPIVQVLDDYVVMLQFDVERRRECDARSSRWISDSDGFRWYLDDRELSADGVRRLQTEIPGRVRLLLPLPRGARRGAMAYSVRMRYYCDPLGLFPIRVEFSVPFFVSPVGEAPRDAPRP